MVSDFCFTVLKTQVYIPLSFREKLPNLICEKLWVSSFYYTFSSVRISQAVLISSLLLNREDALYALARLPRRGACSPEENRSGVPFVVSFNIELYSEKHSSFLTTVRSGLSCSFCKLSPDLNITSPENIASSRLAAPKTPRMVNSQI